MAWDLNEVNNYPEVDSHPEEYSNLIKDINPEEDIYHEVYIHPEKANEANIIIDHHSQNIGTDKLAEAKDLNDETIMSEDEKEYCANRVIIRKFQRSYGDTITLIIY